MPFMKLTSWIILCVAAVASWGAVTPNHQSDVVQTSQGPLKITPLYHGSVMLEFGGKIIHVDPWSQADYTGIPQGDLILISHAHADHMDPAILKTLRKDSTIILTSEAVADTLRSKSRKDLMRAVKNSGDNRIPEPRCHETNLVYEMDHSREN